MSRFVSFLVVLVVVVVVADASVLSRLAKKIKKRQYEIPSSPYDDPNYQGAGPDPMLGEGGMAKFQKVQFAILKVDKEANQFISQFVTFFQKLSQEYEALLRSYAGELAKLIQAAPADEVKSFAVSVLKSTKAALKDFHAIYRDYNPLHPLKEGDTPGGPFRRAVSTLSSFGGAIEELLTSVDELVVLYADQVMGGTMAGVEFQLDAMINQLESLDADFVKMMVLQALQTK